MLLADVRNLHSARLVCKDGGVMQRFKPDEFLKALECAAMLSAEKGEYLESERYLDGAMNLIKRVHGRNSTYALWLIHKGDIAVAQNDLAKASTCYSEAIEILRNHLSENHLAIGVAERNLAEIFHELGWKTDSQKREALASKIFGSYRVQGSTS